MVKSFVWSEVSRDRNVAIGAIEQQTIISAMNDQFLELLYHPVTHARTPTQSPSCSTCPAFGR
jgi:hypothetical protein